MWNPCDLTLEPGTRRQTEICPNVEDWKIPVTVVAGAKPGKSLLITAGTHSCEYPGLPAVIRLAQEIDKKCTALGVRQGILVEVNIGMEESKTGIEPAEFERFMEEISGFPSLDVRGMMTMAPKCTENEEFRKYFRESCRIFLDFFAKTTHNIGEPVLSMGMSDSYECAIEEGSTMVRVGSAIFGSRKYN
jgi:alanine racemase